VIFSLTLLGWVVVVAAAVPVKGSVGYKVVEESFSQALKSG